MKRKNWNGAPLTAAQGATRRALARDLARLISRQATGEETEETTTEEAEADIMDAARKAGLLPPAEEEVAA